MKYNPILPLLVLFLSLNDNYYGSVIIVSGFVIIPTSHCPSVTNVSLLSSTKASSNESDNKRTKAKKDNKAMAFLRKIGKVGGSQDFTNAIGVDEGTVGKTDAKIGEKGPAAIKKVSSAYQPCVNSKIIDDLTQDFPITSCGTTWAGITDKVMGGHSSGFLERKFDFHDKPVVNLLDAKVRLANNGGFVQMATDLSSNPAKPLVDASKYQGLELDLLYVQGEKDNEQFNIHIKNADCLRQFSSYRTTFTLPKSQWTKIKVPFSEFKGHGPGPVDIPKMDTTTLRRVGVVAIGQEFDVKLALSFIGFY